MNSFNATSMNKLEMINYLRDFAIIQENYPLNDIGFVDLIYNYINQNYSDIDDINLYASTICRVYNTYIDMKLYSIVEDYFLNRDDYINNNNLKDFIHNCNFIEKPSNITNKRILELVRNAFNHNINNSFNITKNGKYIKIDIKDARYPKQIKEGGTPEPLKMKFNIDYLYDLWNLFDEYGQNVLYLGFDIPKDFDINSNNLYNELDKVKIVRHYFNNKMDLNDVKQFRTLSKTDHLTNKEKLENSNKLNELADSLTKEVKYDLTIDQKDKMVDMYKKYKKYNPDLIDQPSENIMYFILSNVIPIPGYKVRLIQQQLNMLDLMFNNYTFKDIVQNMNKSLYEKCNIEKIDNLGLSQRLNLMRQIVTRDFSKNFAYIIYIDSVITQLCTDEEITIDNKTYNKERIRNSFVHSRWYIGIDNKIHLFDANPINKYDYDLHEVGKIKIDSFIKWADNYLQKKKKEEDFVLKLKK